MKERVVLIAFLVAIFTLWRMIRAAELAAHAPPVVDSEGSEPAQVDIFGALRDAIANIAIPAPIKRTVDITIGDPVIVSTPESGLKEGVLFFDMHPKIIAARAKIDAISRRMFDGRPLVITSARDGKHMDGSLHYEGKAIDIRTRDLDPVDKIRYHTEIRHTLGPDFDVIVEPTHIHVEYQPSAYGGSR